MMTLFAAVELALFTAIARRTREATKGVGLVALGPLYRFVQLLLFVAMMSNAQARAAELKTSDGLVLRLDERTGQVEGLEVGGQRLGLLKSTAPLTAAEFDAAGAGRNLIPNPGLEDDASPLVWKRDAKASGLSREQNHTPGGKSCGRVSTPPTATAAAPATAPRVFGGPIAAKPGAQYRLRVWGFVAPGGSGGTVYALELDAQGKVIRENRFNVQHGLSFTSATAGRWSSRETSFVSKPDCARIQIYANIWKGFGSFYFDDVELVDVDACWRELPLPAAPLARGADGAWRQTVRLSKDQIEFQLTYRARGDHLQIEAAVQDLRRPLGERAARRS